LNLMAPAVPTTMDELFSKAQVSFGAHKKAAAMLHRLRAASPDSFEDEFFACLACVLHTVLLYCLSPDTGPSTLTREVESLVKSIWWENPWVRPICYLG